MPPAFLDDLASRIAGFERAVNDLRRRRSNRATAGARLNAALASGFRAVRRLDVVVMNVLGADSKAIAEWERARRVARPRRQKAPEMAPLHLAHHDDGSARAR
jgi:hypothetical protein